MLTCDVLIVGGGPAGSSCASRLVQAGADVALVDRARFPRDKVCAGWITPSVVRTLHLDLGDYARGRTIQPFTGFRTGLMHHPLHSTDFGAVVSYGIRRCEFDAYLLNRSGVRQLEPQAVQTIRKEGRDGWIVNEFIRTRMLVGAGGHFCPVARAINGNCHDTPVIAAQEIEFELDPDQSASCAVQSTAPELFFWADLGGYAWCVRKGNFLNIGAGRLTPSPLPAAMHEFVAMLGARGGVLPSAPSFHGHAYLLNRSARRRVHADGVLLIGDAAGLALAPSGEGILSAVESGLMAADVILASAPDYRARRLEAYGERVTGRFGERMSADRTPRTLPRWMSIALSNILLRTPPLTRRVVLEDGFLHTRRADLPLGSPVSGA